MKKQRWTRDESKERFPFPMSTLGWSILQDALVVNLRSISRELGIGLFKPLEVTRLSNGYVYARKPFFGSILNLRPRPVAAAGILFHAALASFDGLLAPFKGISVVRSFLGGFVRRALVPRCRRAIEMWERESMPALAEMKKSNAEFAARDIETHEYPDVKKTLIARGNRFLESDFLVHFTKNALFSYLKYDLEQAGFENAADLTVGLKDNVSIRMYRNMKKNGALDQAFIHLTDNWDISAKTLGEKRSEMVTLLDRLERQDLATFDIENNGRRAQVRSKIQACYEKAGTASSHILFIFGLIELFERLVSIDEEQRFYSSIQYPAAKNLFTSLGRQFAADGRLCEASDIFFLELGEIDLILSGLAPARSFEHDIIRRRTEFDAAWTIQPPMELDGEMRALPTLEKPRLKHFAGASASPGRVQGKARAVRTLDDLFDLEAGEIAILLTPNPIYGPFLDKAAAIVCETGGVLSHGAIIARELAIPAVMGAEGILSSVRNGDSVVVNANDGVVSLI